MDEDKVKHRCYSCHKQCNNNKYHALDCSHILCKKCLSLSLIKTEFKDMTSDAIAFTCLCGIEKSTMPFKEASSLFIPSSKKGAKTCKAHNERSECYCNDCKIWLCSKCKSTFHDQHLSFHHVGSKPTKELNKCQVHHAQFKAYCNQCDNELCLECINNDQSHSSFHFNISDQANIIKEKILARLSMKTREDVYQIIDKAQLEYQSKSKTTYESTKSKIQAVIKYLTEALVKIKETYEKETAFCIFQFDLMRYAYNSYFKAIYSESPSYTLLTNISAIETELTDISIHLKPSKDIDKMLFDIKSLNKERFIKLKANYKLLNGEDREGVSLYKPLTFKTCHSEFMSAMCAIGDGIYCTGGLDNIVKVFQLNKEENSFVFKREFNQHSSCIKHIVNAEFGKVISISTDNAIIIWQIALEKALLTITSPFTKEVNDIVMIGIDHFCICGDHNIMKTLSIEDGHIEKEIVDESLRDTEYSLRKLLWLNEAEMIVSGADDGYLSVWNEGKKEKRILAHQSAILSLIQVEDKLIASGSADNSIRIFSITDFNCMFSLSGYHSSWITSMCYIPSKRLFVSGSKDNSIVLWDSSVSPYKYIKTLTSHKNSILFLSATEQSNLLLSGSCDTLIKLWKHLN